MKQLMTKIKKSCRLPAAILLILFSCAGLSYGEIVKEVKGTLKIPEAPIDIAISPENGKTFVLTEAGNVLIYGPNGELMDKISIGKSFDSIEVSPKGDQLIAGSRKDKVVQIFSIDYVQKINISGSPYKGAKDAPVVIAVFSDFQ